jgi:hypothetical protein
MRYRYMYWYEVQVRDMGTRYRYRYKYEVRTRYRYEVQVHRYRYRYEVHRYRYRYRLLECTVLDGFGITLYSTDLECTHNCIKYLTLDELTNFCLLLQILVCYLKLIK